MDGILGRIGAVINGPTPNLSSHLINYDGRSLTHTDSKGRRSLTSHTLEDGPNEEWKRKMEALLNMSTCPFFCRAG